MVQSLSLPRTTSSPKSSQSDMGGPREKEISSLAVNLQNQVCYVCSKDHDGAGKGQTIPLQESSEWRENEAWHWDRSLPFGAHSEAGKGAPLPAIASLPVFGLHIFIRLVYIFLRWRKLLDKEFQVVLEAMCCWGLGLCMLRGKRPALSGAAPGLRSQPFPHFWVQKKQFFIMKRSTS